MHLVIMAAGEGSRMRPLTDTTPKPLLQICGRTIIEHNIDPILDAIDEIYMIVKYKSEMFREHFSDRYRWKNVHYIEQIETPGTGASLLSLDGQITGDFVVLSGDDLYDAEDLEKLMMTDGYATLCQRVERPQDFGIFIVDEAGRATGIIEKPSDPTVGNFASVGNHKFDDSIFPLLRTLPLSPRWELEITDLIQIYIEQGIYRIVEAVGRWLPIWYPWDLLRANEYIIGEYEETIDKWAEIESQVSISGNVYLEEGVILKSGTYIEGNCYIWKGSVIGPHAYIRGNTSIGRNSKVGAFVEVKNMYLGDFSKIPHLSYIGDSVIGNHVNIGGGSKTGSLRHDGKNIRCMVKEKLIDTGRRKLGVIIWDRAKLAINTLIYPGRVIPTDGTTLPWEIVK